jgi:hypothetical protein
MPVIADLDQRKGFRFLGLDLDGEAVGGLVFERVERPVGSDHNVIEKCSRGRCQKMGGVRDWLTSRHTSPSPRRIPSLGRQLPRDRS